MKEDDHQEFEHESYGLVQFNRVSHGPGRTRLFGSSITTHLDTVRLTIRRGMMQHSLSSDHFFGGGKELIEVELSAAQFAELLTTLNMGSGVPCTILHINRKRMEEPPELPLEAERVRDGFRDSMDKIARRLDKTYKLVQNALGKKTVNKKDREMIDWAFGEIIQDVRANFPFVAEQFQEATDRIVTAGKAEIDAFVTTMVQKTGLKQLQKMSDTPLLNEPPPPPPARVIKEGVSIPPPPKSGPKL